MRVFIYKRTHKGDPNTQGHFGVEDCMGRLRDCSYDAVIGIGGISNWAESEQISMKVNWVGIGPRKVPQPRQRGPIILFDHFRIFEERGKELISIAPLLARRLLHPKAPRFVFSPRLSSSEQSEVNRILTEAQDAPPSLPLPSGVKRDVHSRVCPPSSCSPTSRKRGCLP